MLYPNLTFKKPRNRPFFYTNFVQTVDGKVQVKIPGYWPIGSRKDHEVLMELRAHADALIHGGNLAREFGEITLKSLGKSSFKALRKKFGKDPNLPYFVVTTKPEEFSQLKANIYAENLDSLVKELQSRGYKHILLEGGPTLLGSFLKENLIDEIFLTITPKIFGSEKGNTLTLVEGILFPPEATKKLKLLSIKPIEDEIFLRYTLEN